jgi:GT2 family glycosyltransferase
MKNKYDLVISIVIYKQPISQIKKVIESFFKINSILSVKICIFDNSKSLGIESFSSENNIEYYSSPKNIGFGAGHNYFINKFKVYTSFFLILNPDVYLTGSNLLKLVNFAKKSANSAIVSPRLLNDDLSIQYNCRLFPSPFSLINRRIKFFYNSYVDELRFTGYNKTINVPFIHGACYLLNPRLFDDTNYFDENYFLYMEDADLCKRVILAGHNITFFSGSFAIHSHQKGSRKNFKLLYYHIKSALYFYVKWGFFSDRHRKEVNLFFLKKYKI